ncbi:hypothetical protein WN943_000098 [Citrus x changshan-huyou]
MPNKALHEKKRGQCSQGQLAGKLKMYKHLRQVILGCVVQLSASSGKTLLTNNGKMIVRFISIPAAGKSSLAAPHSLPLHARLHSKAAVTARIPFE